MRATTHVNNCGGELSDIVFHEPRPFDYETCPGRTETSVSDLQHRIVRHCAPTLAGLKCGSMFRVGVAPHGILSHIDEILDGVEGRGVSIEILTSDDSSSLVYVYRPKLLAARLADPEVEGFLSGYGYSSMDVEVAMAELKLRFERCPSIPPEIGVFLDYPMDDVIGYIINEGKCCRCIGCWKVYGDVEAAEKKFSSFKKCREIYSRRLSEGTPFVRLAIRC